MTSWPALNVYADFGSSRSDPTDPSAGGTWSDIGPYVESCTINRGVSRYDGVIVRYQPATCQLVLKNTDGRFDPLNTSGPYASGGISYVRPVRGIAVQVVWNSVRYYLFRGGINSWTPTYPNDGRNAICTVDAMDGLGFLSRVADVASGTVPFFTSSPTTSQVVRNWLLQCPTPYSQFLHNIAGIGSVGIACADEPTISGSILQGVQLAVDTEIGEFWLDGNAVCKFRTRTQLFTDSRSNVSNGTFQPNTSLPFDDVTLTRDVQGMYNSCLADTPDGVTDPQQADNNAASLEYGLTRLERRDLLHRTDQGSKDFAGWVVDYQAEPELRLDNLQLVPQANAANLFPHALGRELGDRITIAFTPPGSSAISRDAFIRGISHSFTSGASWVTKWALQDAAKFDQFLIFDDSTKGKLDTGKMGY